MLQPLAFRKRLLVILSLFAIVPTAAVTIAWAIGVGVALPMFSESTAWEKVATSGSRVLDSLRGTELTPGQEAVLRSHEMELEQSITQARRFRFLADRAIPVVVFMSILGLAIVGVLASRVAGHLSRQLSRPLSELVGWTERIAKGEALPESASGRGAPEFAVLRDSMRVMAREIEAGRARALEAERLAAFRESARRFAHELKNALTPMHFAVSRLEREAPPSLDQVVEVLATETHRLDEMSRAFSQFGRLPEGPVSDVDVAELVRYTAQSTIPPDIAVHLEVASELPVVRGQHDALQRALANVLRNAVEACSDAGGNGGLTTPVIGDRLVGDTSVLEQNGDGARRINVAAERTQLNGMEAVSIAVRDTGCGIAPERIEKIWEPYVTSKAGGTGLGLAIARQTILAHRGRVEAMSEPDRGTTIRLVLPTMGTDGAVEIQERNSNTPPAGEERA